MIDLYTWSTPNGRKVSIMLEETGLPYNVIPVNIGYDEQYEPSFTEKNPNNKIPAIVDRDNDDFTLAESGAILYYLAEKAGQFLPPEELRWETLQWMMFQMSHIGPMFGQVHHFVRHNPGKAPYAEQRYYDEAERLYDVLDQRLEDHEYLVGDYSIVDIATWPWTARFDWQTIDLNEFPNVKRWYLAIAARPAVQAGWNIPPSDQGIPMP